MKCHRRLHSFVCGTVLIFLAFQADASIAWYSYFDGKKYTFSLSEEDIEAMKPWRMDREEALPVSPKEIHRVARVWIDKLKTTDGWNWHLEELSLVPIRLHEEKWVWKAEFDYQVTKGGQTGQSITMKVFITTDGRLIQPIVADTKR